MFDNVVVCAKVPSAVFSVKRSCVRDSGGGRLNYRLSEACCLTRGGGDSGNGEVVIGMCVMLHCKREKQIGTRCCTR